MMTDDTTVDISDDLDAFEDEFFQREKEDADTGKDTPATDEDKDASADDQTEDETEEAEEEAVEEEEGEADDSDEEEEEEPEPEPEPKPKGKKSAQERINELTRARREAERQNAELLRRLEAVEARTREESKINEPLREQLPQGSPKPDDLDANGEPKYALGEFDPAFIHDITRFTINEEIKATNEQRAREEEARQIAAAQAELSASWVERLDKAEEETPEIRENISELVDTFSTLDPAYGEYLAMQIMQTENGPEIMNYLSQNIGEAQKIVASGPAAATLAIGRLDARMSRVRPDEGKGNAKKKVSNAPEPPAKATTGRKGQTTVRPDTDDLDAFERMYFTKR